MTELIQFISSKQVITHIEDSFLERFDLPLNDRGVSISRRAIKHIKKHMKDFSNEDEFWYHLNQIPEIINKPDYVGLHPNGDSLQFIKRVNEWTLVAVRIQGKDACSVRTMYPINQQKLDNYIESGRIIPMND